ncbi:protein MOR1-like [Iris pallida]|uniref:Protein MOR1-like n=1 Tax=Iris pallida TaxID=29817 RepID=A0AAX6F2U5_IRIPA|nr:protein MOR1-like [Iris pallida]
MNCVSFMFRFMRSTRQRSRSTESGFAIRAETIVTTCRREYVILLLMVLSSRCTLKWGCTRSIMIL